MCRRLGRNGKVQEKDQTPGNFPEFEHDLEKDRIRQRFQGILNGWESPNKDKHVFLFTVSGDFPCWHHLVIGGGKLQFFFYFFLEGLEGI